MRISDWSSDVCSSDLRGPAGGRNPSLLAITEEGARFRSYVDGAVHTLTPEEAIRIQRGLGADIVLVLDQCTPHAVERVYTAQSIALTHRWAGRRPAECARPAAGSAGARALFVPHEAGVFADRPRQTAD